ncbi:hypothetical protein OCEANICA350_11848 [Oceanicaulis sp. 350]|nr:hypothetical protein OCEANICA350_11848 [Oceanicaulis sp. 350]
MQFMGSDARAGRGPGASRMDGQSGTV